MTVPVSFPGCRHCAHRPAGPARVCLACVGRAVGVAAVAAPGEVCCGACGRPGPARRPCANPWCRRADRGWSSVFAVGAHRGALRRAIAAYKFGGEAWRGPVFARLLAGLLDARPTWFEEYDRLVAVPSFTGPGARRAWDPVGSIFAEMAGLVESSWACEPGAVVKVGETPPLSGRSRRQRVAVAETALRRALVVPDPSVVRGGRVLVVDDVLTEGSTLREVARALLGAGAEEVAGLVLARRVPPSVGPTSRAPGAG